MVHSKCKNSLPLGWNETSCALGLRYTPGTKWHLVHRSSCPALAGVEQAAAGFLLDCNKKGLSTNSVLKYCFNKIVGTSDVPSDAEHPAFVHLDGPGMDFSYGRLRRSVCVEGLFPPASRCLLFCSNHGSSKLLLTAWKRYLCYNIHQLTAQAGPEHTIVTEATPCWCTGLSSLKYKAQGSRHSSRSITPSVQCLLQGSQHS